MRRRDLSTVIRRSKATISLLFAEWTPLVGRKENVGRSSRKRRGPAQEAREVITR